MAACRGVLLGLYAVRDKGADDLLGHAPDFPDETAAHALDQFRTALGRRPGKAAKLRAMVAGMDEWDWLDVADGATEAARTVQSQIDRLKAANPEP